MKKLLLLFLLPLSALAQTTRTVTLDAATDSIWAVPTWVNTTVSVNSVSLLDATGATIASGSAGQVGFLQSSVSVTFPAVANAVTVSSVSFGGTQTPASGKWSGTFNIMYTLPAPLALVAGEIPTIIAQQGVMAGNLSASIVTPGATAPPPVVTPPPPVVTPPPVKVWVTIANQHQGFTLTASTLVRYGEVATSRFNLKTLAAGSYTCDNAQFGDPAVGVDAKVCQK